MLPAPFHWITDGQAARLYMRYGWLATVRPGRVEIGIGSGRVGGPCGSIEQGMRYVERWVAAKYGLVPEEKRAAWHQRRRERFLASLKPQDLR